MRPTCDFYKPSTAYNYLYFAKKRLAFLRRHLREVKHCMNHLNGGNIDFSMPLRTCQVALIEKMRKEIPYSKHTWRKDILWRIVKDYRSMR